MIPLMRNAFYDERRTRVRLADFILSDSRLSMGQRCAEFEARFAEYQGRDEAVLFNSGASANLALIQAMLNTSLLCRGDKVGVSAITWATNVMPLIQLGLEPVLLDCSPATLNVMSAGLDCADLSAVFVTNALGFCGDLPRVKADVEGSGAILLEDNCEALGTELPEGRCGNFGIASTFSFFVGHHLSTIEGGMVCTDNEVLADQLRMVRANGWDRNLHPRQQLTLRKNHGIAGLDSAYAFYDLGYNLRPTEVTGFLGVEQLPALRLAIANRLDRFTTLEFTLEQNPDLVKLDRSHILKLSPFAFPIMARSPELRAKYVGRFLDNNIEVRPMIAGNLAKQPFWRKYQGDCGELPGAKQIDECGFYCGLFPNMTSRDVDTIAGCLAR